MLGAPSEWNMTMADGNLIITVDALNLERFRDLLREALRALEYHREQTRPISQNDEVIGKLREALGSDG